MEFRKFGDRHQVAAPIAPEGEKIRTIQSQRDETDINLITSRYLAGGEVLHLNENMGRYGDVSDIQTFHEAQNRVAEVNSTFAALPAVVRDLMGNSARKFVALMSNPDYAERFARLEEGLPEEPELPPEKREDKATPEEKPPEKEGGETPGV